MKEVAGTATIIASIAIAIALMLMAPKGLEANPGPIVSSDGAGPSTMEPVLQQSKTQE